MREILEEVVAWLDVRLSVNWNGQMALQGLID
jgi:hypothetical protein